MAPAISPKKSWEGFAGSVALQCLVGALSFVYLLDAPWWQGLIAGLVMTVTATAGDFAESAIKRDLGVVLRYPTYREGLRAIAAAS